MPAYEVVGQREIKDEQRNRSKKEELCCLSE
jgi:hypothetical protein